MNLIIIKIFIGTIFHFFLNLFFEKIKLFKDNLSSSNHKKLAVENKKTLLTGGFSILILLFLFFEENFQLKLFCLLMLSIGLVSDLNIINSPIKRLITQTIVISIFIFQFGNNIFFTNILLLDAILKYKLISYLFTIYCFLIIINGTNFIDGLNGLVLGYYFLSFLTLLIFIINKNVDYDYTLIITVLLIIIVNYPYNLIGKNFLGDSGSYLIAFITGFVLVDFYKSYSEISSLFIVTLLWYPAFENFFSIIRKKINNKNPSKPDTDHLHQLIFKLLLTHFSGKKKTNIISGLVINFYNLIVFILAYFLFNSSIGLFILLLFNLVIYTTCYFIIFKKLNNSNSI